VITLSAIISGLVLAALGYQLIQLWVLHQSANKMPRGPVTGLGALVGTDAEVVEAFKRGGPTAPALGRVRIGSELWRAELAATADRMAGVGEQVRVIGVRDMTLTVECR